MNHPAKNTDNLQGTLLALLSLPPTFSGGFGRCTTEELLKTNKAGQDFVFL